MRSESDYLEDAVAEMIEIGQAFARCESILLSLPKVAGRENCPRYRRRPRDGSHRPSRRDAPDGRSVTYSRLDDARSYLLPPHTREDLNIAKSTYERTDERSRIRDAMPRPLTLGVGSRK